MANLATLNQLIGDAGIVACLVSLPVLAVLQFFVVPLYVRWYNDKIATVRWERKEDADNDLSYQNEDGGFSFAFKMMFQDVRPSMPGELKASIVAYRIFGWLFVAGVVLLTAHALIMKA